MSSQGVPAGMERPIGCVTHKLKGGKIIKEQSRTPYNGNIPESISSISIAPSLIDVDNLMLYACYEHSYLYEGIEFSFYLGVLIKKSNTSYFFFEQNKKKVHIFRKEALQEYLRYVINGDEERKKRIDKDIEYQKKKTEMWKNLECNMHNIVNGEIITTKSDNHLFEESTFLYQGNQTNRVFLVEEININTIVMQDLYKFDCTDANKETVEKATLFKFGIFYNMISQKKEESFLDKMYRVISMKPEIKPQKNYHFVYYGESNVYVNIYSEDALKMYSSRANMNTKNLVIAWVVMLQELIVHYHLDCESSIDLYDFLGHTADP
jgi:hypothetical protein